MKMIDSTLTNDEVETIGSLWFKCRAKLLVLAPFLEEIQGQKLTVTQFGARLKECYGDTSITDNPYLAFKKLATKRYKIFLSYSLREFIQGHKNDVMFGDIRIIFNICPSDKLISLANSSLDVPVEKILIQKLTVPKISFAEYKKKEEK